MNLDALISVGLRPAFFVPLIVILVLGVPAFFLLKRAYRIRTEGKDAGLRDYEINADGWLIPGWMTAVSAAIVTVVAAISGIPYDFKYAQIYRVSGEVLSVSNVFEDASGAITGEPVIQLDSLPVAVTSDNVRLVNLIGEQVTLTCTVNWRYAAADRLSCDLFEVAS